MCVELRPVSRSTWEAGANGNRDHLSVPSISGRTWCRAYHRWIKASIVQNKTRICATPLSDRSGGVLRKSATGATPRVLHDRGPGAYSQC